MTFALLNEKWGNAVFGTSAGEITWSMSLSGLQFDSLSYPGLSEANFEAAIRASFDTWEDVADLDFTEVSARTGLFGGPGADIDIIFAPIPGNTIGYADNFTGNFGFTGGNLVEIQSVDIVIDASEFWLPDTTGFDLSLYAVMVHEIGHGIGLAHVDDDMQIMFPQLFRNTLGDGDIAGAQFIYGERPGTPGQKIRDLSRYGSNDDDILAGDAGNDTFYGWSGNDQFDGKAGGDRFLGGNGIDRVLYASANTGVVADLILTDRNTGDAAGDTYDSIELVYGSDHGDELRGTQTNNVIAGFSGDDRLFGRGGDDALYGHFGNDHLHGGAGADGLYGGFGFDRVLYNTSSTGLTVDLLLTDRNTGEAAGDTYDSIELVFGSAHDDEIRGTQTNNLLVGNAGTDHLYGRGGDDDLYGGAGNDLLDGGAGRDEFFGGTGIDRVAYFSATAGVTADFINPFLNTGDAQGDTYSSIELLFGSSFGDDLRGSNSNNVIAGLNGADKLFGRGGDDDIFGGAGSDWIAGDSGNDDLYGGTGADRFVFGTNVDDDIVHDFANNTDTLVFNDALWNATLTAQQVVNTYGSVSNGNTVFDFGAFGSVTVVGITNLAWLVDDIAFI